MKAIRKRSEWQKFLWHIRHPWLSCRAAALYEIRRKRVLREFIEWDYKENKEEYEREFRKELRRERRKPIRVQRGPNIYYLPPSDF